MTAKLLRLYDKIILSHPLLTLLVTLGLCGLMATQIPSFKLDASADSLILENDADLRYFRKISEKYDTGDVLLLLYSPKQDIFASDTIADLKNLRDSLKKLNGIASVTTILDVPLLFNTDAKLDDLADKDAIKTLETPGVDLEKARDELLTSPVYHNRMLSSDAATTAILLNLPSDPVARDLVKQRYKLREKQYDKTITPEETKELSRISDQFRLHGDKLTEEQNLLILEIRSIMEKHRGQAELFLGGVPMIVNDMIAFIRDDLVLFSIAVFFFLVITLITIFRKKRWVLLSLLCCSAAVVTMIGFLGLVNWHVTVISSNFISLMLIFTMSLTIHLIVRYRELHAEHPDAEPHFLIQETVRLKFLPCLYTTLTTIVAFTSLLVCNIRPVIDFGLMMTIGLVVSFVLSFILFPAGVLALKRDMQPPANKKDKPPLTLIFARITEAHGGKIIALSLILAIFSIVGITRLKVENKFIDYFREKTEIHQGMKLIDSKLGGTTPLDILVEFDRDEVVAEEPVDDPDDDFDDDFGDDDPFGAEDKELAWYISGYKMEQVEKIHDFLLSLPEIGEVMSIATATKIATRLNGNEPLDNFEIALLHKKSPEDIKKLLITPYIAEDIPQARFTLRVVESAKDLNRQKLLTKIHTFLHKDMGFADDQIHFTSMFVLYNNMLQSLYRSQILTIAVVFLAILAMFFTLFRSFSLSIIGLIPNLLPAAMILGIMGWSGIPLDMMTITIAAITIGIAVDNTIHYIHRFKKEFTTDHNYTATMHRCHASIGRAMFYTSITIIIGFSILVTSNFIPTIYFGLFTGLGMFVALLAALTLLPQLILIMKPLGPEGNNE